jgi:hypothetical protein
MLANPLSGKSKAEIIADVNEWTRENGMEDLVDTFRKGALVAANPGESRPALANVGVSDESV